MLFLVLVFIPFLLILVYLIARYLWELIPVSDMKNKAVLITGCDSGFGWQIALKCAQNGIPTFAGCLTEEGCRSLESEAKHFPGPFFAIPLNVTLDDDIQKAYSFVQNHLKPGQKLWAIINNAGAMTSYGPAEWVSIEQFSQALNINTLGQIRVIKTFLPMIKESKGRICSTTSGCGLVIAPYMASYNVSKFATEGLMDTLRHELKPWGIKCCIFEPGAAKTGIAVANGLWEGLVRRTWANTTAEQKKEYGEKFKDDLLSTRLTRTASFPNETPHIINDYYHAITARYPRARYASAWDTTLYHVPLSVVIPTELQDWIHSIKTFILIKNNRT